MRILMLSHGYPPTISGVTLITQKFSRILHQRGHEVLVITASERGNAYQDEDQGVKLIRLRSYRNPYWKEGPHPFITPHQLENLILEFRPDIIHTHANINLSYQLLKVKRSMMSTPFVSSAYSMPSFILNYSSLGERIETWLQNLIWKYLIYNLNQYDHVIFSNGTLQRMYRERGLLAPSSVISNGVNTNRYHPADGKVEAIELKYSLPPSPRLLHVSRLARDKQIDLLIKAMPELYARSGAHLILVGRGDDRLRLKSMVNDMHLAHCVHMLGYIPEEDLPAIYQACDLFVLVALCETQSLPALQALVTGLPLILAEAGCLPELVEEGVNGYLVPPNDYHAISQAALRILNSPQRADDISNASLAIGLPHSEQYSVSALIDLYDRMISGDQP